MRKLFIGLLFGLFACQHTENPVVEMPSPASEKSGEPAFFQIQEDQPGMSWLESKENEVSLKYATYSEGEWSDARTIVSGSDLLANWADFPGIVTNGKYWLAWYLKMSNPETFSYDVMITQSSDAGNSWTTPQKLHADTVQAEHGFVSAVPAEGGFQLIWLDGRNSGGEHGAGAMNIRSAKVGFDGTVSNRLLLDDRTCDCCQTTLAALPKGGFMALYRDRSEEEVRDMSFVVFDTAIVSDPTSLHHDNWKIEGCPVNGPRVTSSGNEVGVVWFTLGEDGVSKIQFAISEDGQAFSKPILVDTVTIGRVDVLSKDNTYYLSYLDEGKSGANIKVAEVKDYNVVNMYHVADVSASRKTGFPRMMEVPGGILVAYTNADLQQIKVVKLSF